jgi:hypothetical protein
MAPSESTNGRPPHLVVAERWLKAAGKPVQWGEIRIGSPNAPVSPMLVIQQGPLAIFVRPQNDCLAVFVVADVPIEARQKLSLLPSDLKQRMFIRLRQELLTSSRCGFALMPPELSRIEQLERFVVEQVIAIDESDASTRNRLLDAVLEVTNATMRAGGILQPADQATASGVRSGDDPRSTAGTMFR